MRANILFCLYFFMGLAVQLQAQVTVTGKVIDEQQQPVPYANIVLLSLPDSAFVAGSISNEEGAFSLNVKETKDVLRISSIGYATVYRPLDNRSTDLGIICLASDTQILAEVGKVVCQIEVDNGGERVTIYHRIVIDLRPAWFLRIYPCRRTGWDHKVRKSAFQHAPAVTLYCVDGREKTDTRHLYI